MSSINASPPQSASATRRGLMSAAHYTKLDALMSAASQESRFSALETDVGALEADLDSAEAAIATLQASSHAAVTLDGASSSWLTLVGQALKLTLVAATTGVAGILTAGAQVIDGAKTFASAVVMSAGLTITGTIVGDGGITSSAGSSVLTLTESFMKGARGTAKWSLNEASGGSAQLYNTSAGVEVTTTETRIYGRGTQSTDVAVKIGPSTADGSVHASAKIASFGTGVGGTYVEKIYLTKGGRIVQTDFGGLSMPTDSAGVLGLGLCEFFGSTVNGVISYRYNSGSVTSTINTSTGEHAAPKFTASNTVQLNTAGNARPTADATSRGTLWYSKSAGGAADTLQICLKSAADTYSWVTIGTG